MNPEDNEIQANPESNVENYAGSARPGVAAGENDPGSKLMEAPGKATHAAKSALKAGSSMGGGSGAGSSGGSGGIGSSIGKMGGGKMNPGGSGGGSLPGGGLKDALNKWEKGTGISKNPSEADASKKMAGAAKVNQAAKDAVDTMKDAKDIATAIEGNPQAIMSLIQRDVMHPIETMKRLSRMSKIALGFVIFNAAFIGSIALLLVFALYKVAVMVTGITDMATAPSKIMTEFRVNRETAQYLISIVPQLVLNDQIEQGKKNGVALASELSQETVDNNNLSGVTLSPATKKMHEAWKSAHLEKDFMEKYKAKLLPNGSAANQINSFDPAAWDLYVQDKRIGDLTSDKAVAFMSVFTKQTMHWDDIYTRVGLRRVAQERFDSKEGKLKLEDVGLDMKKSRTNVTKKLVTDTMKPLETRSETYFWCTIEGGESCDNLGLGSVGSPKNYQINCGGGFFSFLCKFRQAAHERLVSQEFDKKTVEKAASEQPGKVVGEVDNPDKRTSLVGLVSTGISEAVLKSVPKDIDGTPNKDALLDLYERFGAATENGNLGRMMYDRYSNQSIKQSMNYFVGGGQIQNWDMDITNAWSITDNLSIVEESPIYRRAFMSGSMDVFADGNEKFTKSCQTTFNDPKPVYDGTDYKTRPKNQNVCFSKTLMPVVSEFQKDKNLIEIYKQLDGSSSGSLGVIGGIVSSISQMLSQAASGQIRTSPIANNKLGIETKLSPDYDGYNNQIYGSSLSGGETSGEAFEAMWSAMEAINSVAQTDETYGMGSQYLTNQQVSQALNYSSRIDKIALNYRSFPDRMFSLKTSSSVAGQLAMLAPTNKRDGVNKLAQILSPGALINSVAIKLTPSAIASSKATSSMVNPVNAAKMGYAVDDPSSRMDGAKLWDTYKCDEGGPTQTKQTISVDTPFNLPVTTNPCKRENTLSIITTCWFDTKDSCSLDGKGSGSISSTAPAPNSNVVPTEDTSAMSCPAGTEDGGVHQDYGERGTPGIKLRICGIPGSIPASRGVNASIAANVLSLINSAKSSGISLGGGAFRSYDDQVALRKSHCGTSDYDIYEKPSGSCKPPTARPGNSNHEIGVAIDFSNCNSHSSACYKWLAGNAANFGLFNLPSEPWHWSIDGR